MMAENNTLAGIPGVRGKDYEIVNFAGKIYAVFREKLPNGKWVTTAWRVTSDDLKTHKIDQSKVRHITQGQFKKLNVFGTIGDIVRTGASGEHPLKTYLKELRSIYGPKVSWLNDKEYMSVFIMGWMEGWDPQIIQQRLKRTNWYQSRTAAQRAWELDYNNAERRTAVEGMTTQVTEALQDLYGPTFNLGEQGITGSQISKWAKEIASGELGNPDTGFQIWLEEQRNKAEKIEGSQAWIDRETAEEEQRDFLNRPEDMYQKIKDDALYWLGPNGMPSEETLGRWSSRLVSEKSSDADWQQFLQKQAQRLYPWLDASTPWQEFADPYKRMTEDLLGRPVGWDDPTLRQLGALDPNGVPTGTAQTFKDFELALRKTPEFWQSPTAAEEGFGLFNLLNETFQGVPS